MHYPIGDMNIVDEHVHLFIATVYPSYNYIQHDDASGHIKLVFCS